MIRVCLNTSTIQHSLVTLRNMWACAPEKMVLPKVTLQVIPYRPSQELQSYSVFCAAETAFLRAEGKLKNWSVGNKSAKEYYEEGIKLSMEQYGTTMPDNYLTNTEKPTVSHNNDPRGHAYTISNTVAVAWNDNNEEENLQRIITQKWIANYPLGLEAWAEYRRTGYPELYPCIDNLSRSWSRAAKRGMRRLSFPYTEAQNNHANYELGVS